MTDPVCVPPGESSSSRADTIDAYPEAILAYLNAGGSPDGLDEVLYEAGVANQPTAVASGDFNGDGKDDLAVSIIDAETQLVLPPGVLLIYICRGDQFELSSTRASGEMQGGAHIWYVQDLDADGREELVVSYPNCGAHTCFDEVEVMDWGKTALENRLQGTTSDLPYIDVRLNDPDGDGVFDLEVVSGGFGSVGAGPNRGVLRRWALNLTTGMWEVAEEQLLPSDFRIHVLHDADAAARRGEFAEALVLYERVINDTTLNDWVDPAYEQAMLSGYARFRTVVIHTRQGNFDFARTELEELRSTAPPGSPSHGFTELAGAYFDGFQEGGVEGGCDAARAYAGTHPEAVLEPLGSAHFGYANPAYAPEDICPTGL
jgi:hypothetical protein